MMTQPQTDARGREVFTVHPAIRQQDAVARPVSPPPDTEETPVGRP